jgi:hypothetical protein
MRIIPLDLQRRFEQRWGRQIFQVASTGRSVSFRFDVAWPGDQHMRVLGILVLAIALAGCTGDRGKQGQSPGTTPSLIVTA